jgi:hypothetical protein
LSNAFAGEEEKEGQEKEEGVMVRLQSTPNTGIQKHFGRTDHHLAIVSFRLK